MRDIDRFRHEVKSALFHRFDGLFDSAVCRHEQDRDRLVDFFLDFQNLDARTCGQSKVGDHKLVRLLADLFCGSVPVGSFIDLVTGFLDRGSQHLTEAVLIFNEKNFHILSLTGLSDFEE